MGVCGFVQLTARNLISPCSRKRSAGSSSSGAVVESASNCNQIVPFDATLCAVELSNNGIGNDAFVVLGNAALSTFPLTFIDTLFFAYALEDVVSDVVSTDPSILSTDAAVNGFVSVVSPRSYDPPQSLAAKFNAYELISASCPVAVSQVHEAMIEATIWSQACGVYPSILSSNKTGVVLGTTTFSVYTDTIRTLFLQSTFSKNQQKESVTLLFPSAKDSNCQFASALLFPNFNSLCNTGVKYPHTGAVVYVSSSLNQGTIQLQFESTSAVKPACSYWNSNNNEWIVDQNVCKTTLNSDSSVSCSCVVPSSISTTTKSTTKNNKNNKNNNNNNNNNEKQILISQSDSAYFSIVDQNKPKIPAGTIAGGVIGGIVIATLALIAFFAYMRKKLNPFRSDGPNTVMTSL